MEPWRVYLLDRVLQDHFLPFRIVHDIAQNVEVMLHTGVKSLIIESENENNGENAERELSYLFYEESNIEWVDGCEFAVSDFDIVYTDTIKIIG